MASVKKIALNGKYGQGKFLVVSDQDFSRCSKINWWLTARGYPRAYLGGGRKNATYMFAHQFILGPKDGFEIDHKNGDKLDCRRNNLRYATHHQNLMNQSKTRGTSRFMGVSWRKDTKKWSACISINNKTVHLGSFETEEQAATAYNTAAENERGQFAKLNQA